MTLLEVIVALTVAGAALAAGAAVLGFLTDQQARTGAQAILSAHAVRTTMRDWAAGARLSTEGDAEFRGTPPSRGMLGSLPSTESDRAEDELTFVTSAPTEVAPAGTHVHFYMKRAGDTSQVHGLVAELTPWRRAGVPVIVSLAPDAVGFQARYLGSIFGQRVWRPSWVSTSVLPMAVELRVLFDSSAASPDRAAHALLALPMTIPLATRR
jgi:type II secretory pathway pseudopilin PulG